MTSELTPQKSVEATVAYGMFYRATTVFRDEKCEPLKAAYAKVVVEKALEFARPLPERMLEKLCADFSQEVLNIISASNPLGITMSSPADGLQRQIMKNAVILVRDNIAGERIQQRYEQALLN